MAVFIKTRTTADANELANLFVEHVFSKHGLPNDIVSDRGSLFVSAFWTALCDTLKITRNLSTAYHPETDGQTERINQILEQYLRMYVNYQQDDWTQWIPLAEFAYNNSRHSSTKQTPFETVYGRSPCFESIHLHSQTPAYDYLRKIKTLQEELKVNLEAANQRYKEIADRHRAKPPHFNTGDKVWLDSKNIRTTRPTRKLSEKHLGPFEIVSKVSDNAFRLLLPSSWKGVHPVFHVSLLDKAEPPFPGRDHPPPEPVVIAGEEEWEVSRILDSRVRRGQTQYLVEWKGFQDDSDRTSWEPLSNLSNALDTVKAFHTKYPLKPQS